MTIVLTCSTTLWAIEFTIKPMNATRLMTDPVMVSLSGIYFQHATHQATLHITTTTGTVQFLLPITPFTGITWNSWNFTSKSLSGTCIGITITTGSGFDASCTLDVMSVALQQRDIGTGDMKQSYYSYSFNYQDRAMQNASAALGQCLPPGGKWTPMGNVNMSARDQWLLATSVDTNFDGSYDESMLQMNTGGGSSFTDGINNLWEFDTDGNGVYETRMFFTRVSRLDVINGYCTNTTTIVKQVSTDADQNGYYENVVTWYDSLTSNPQNESIRVQWNGTGWVDQPFTYTDCRWIESQTVASDPNQDGTFDSEVTAQDLWPDVTSTGLPSLETRNITTRAWVYNATSSTKWSLQVHSTQECDLLKQNMNFTLLCQDDQHFTNMSVVVIDPCPVVIDPRPDVCDGARVDTNGSAWFWSSHNNGIYDVIFIFTHITKTMSPPEAIGVSFNYNDDYRVDWEWWYYVADTAGQKFFPTYWTSTKYNFKYIENIAYDDAWNNYLAQFGSTKYWADFAVETGINLGVALIAIGVGTEIGGFYGFLAGLAVGMIWGVVNYYTNAEESLIDLINNALPEGNTNYVGNTNKDSGDNDTWTFAAPNYSLLPPPGNAYQYFQTWCAGIALNPADTTHLTSYPIDIPNFSDINVTGDNAAAYGYNTMSAADRYVQFEWQFREVFMAKADADLNATTRGAYTCYMPTIDDKGRVGWFAAPKWSITTDFYGTPRPPAEPCNDTEDLMGGEPFPWITHVKDVQDSPGFKVDMAIALMASKYYAAYQHEMSTDQSIFWINMAVQCVQVVIVTLLTEGIGAGYALDNPESTFAKNFGEVSMTRVAVSVTTAVAINTVAGYYITKGIEAAGLDPFIAGQLSNLAASLLAMGISSWVMAKVSASRNKAAASNAIKAEAGDGDCTPEEADRLNKMDSGRYVRLIIAVAAEMDEDYWDTAAQMAVERMGTFRIRFTDALETVDRGALVREDWSKGGQPVTRIEQEETTKLMIAQMAALPVLGDSLMSYVVTTDPIRAAWDLGDTASDPRTVAFCMTVPGQDGGGGMTISWDTISRMTLKQFVALAMASGGCIIGYDPIPQTTRDDGLLPEVSPEIQTSIVKFAYLEVKDTQAIVALEDTLKPLIMADYKQYWTIGLVLKAYSPYSIWANQQILSDLEPVKQEGQALTIIRMVLENAPSDAEAIKAPGLTLAIEEMTSMSRDEASKLLEQLTTEGWLVKHENGYFGLNTPAPANPAEAVMNDIDQAAQLDAARMQPPSTTEDNAIDNVLAQQEEGLANAEEVNPELANARMQALIAEGCAIDGIRASIAEGLPRADALNSLTTLLEEHQNPTVSTLPALPERAAADVDFLKKGYFLFTSTKLDANNLQITARILAAASRAEFGYEDILHLLELLAKGNKFARNNVFGASLEIPVEDFARWTASNLNDWSAKAGTDTAFRSGYIALLRQLCFDDATIKTILAHGSSMIWSVPEGVDKKIDVWLKGQAGNFFVSVAFECKAMSIRSWNGIDIGLTVEIPTQAGIAMIEGEPISAFFLAETNPAVGKAGGLQAITWAGNTLVPFGAHKLLNRWYDALAVNPTNPNRNGFLANTKYSLVETDESGKVVNGYYIMADPDYHVIKGLLSLVPDGSGGYKPLVDWDANTGQFVLTYQVWKYTGTPCSLDSSLNHMADYVEKHNLPADLTRAQYYMAQVLDASGISYKISDVKTPQAQLDNLNKLLNLYSYLFAPPQVVTFKFYWLVGESHASFTSALNTFLNSVTF